MCPKIFLSLIDVYYNTNPSFVSSMAARGWKTALRLEGQPCAPDQLREMYADADVFVVNVNPVTAEMMDAAPNLRLIAVFGAGYQQVDVEAATRRGIYVTAARGGSAIAVAEQCFALFLSLSRRVQVDDKRIRAGEWISPVGQELYGKTLGIIGLGIIGKEVARIAKHGFNMDVLAYDPYLTAAQAAQIGVRQVSLEELLRQSDYVSVHTPLTEATEGLINKETLALMKPTAFLANMSRGAVVREGDLYEALISGQIAGAGLDVHGYEPISPEHPSPFVALDNVVLTSHAGAGSVEAVARIGQMITENIEDVLAGRAPRNFPVNQVG